MKRLVCLIVAVLAAGFVFGGGAARADRVIGIYNWNAFEDIVVDEPHNRVFVTDSDEVYGFSLDGVVAAETYVREAGQMTLSPDGAQLLVASEDGIKFLDPTTLETVRTLPLPTAPCPDAMAVASGMVFFSYGDCTGSSPGLAALNLSNDAITTGLTTGVAATDVQMVSVPAAPNMLVASLGGTVSVLDTVGGATPSTTVRATTGSIGAIDLALAPDGGSVLVADGSTSQKTFATTDLAPLAERTGTSASRAVGVRADGMVADGRKGIGAPDLSFFSAGADTSLRDIDMGTGRYPAPRGLAFGSKRAYVVSTNSIGENPKFHQIFAAPTSQVAITTDKRFYSSGSTATVAVRIVGGGATGIVNLYEKQYGVQKRLVKRAHIDPATGRMLAKVQLLYNTTFTVEFEGDDDHGPGVGTKAVPVRTKLTLSSRHDDSMSGPYHRLPSASAPLIHGESRPTIYHGCVRMVLSVRRSDGSWRFVDGISCLETTMSGTFSARIVGMKPGTRARVTATYVGGTKNAASLPTYYYILFT